MIRVRLQIGDGEVKDTYSAYGMIYLDADERTEAPIKGRAVTSYAEEAGEHTDARTVQDAFDYTATFIFEAKNGNLDNINVRIRQFNELLYTQAAGSDIRTYKTVTLYNDLNRVKIVGLPEPIAEPKEVYHSNALGGFDYAKVELKIRVSDPTKCEWDTAVPVAEQSAMQIRTVGEKTRTETNKIRTV